MRLLRVSLTDYRGITHRDVTFGETGVTVLEGANESGKSSLIEAVGLLLDFKDSSKAQAVKAVQPIGRDVGSRVEVEATVGGVHFTCTKQFHRQTATELAIHAPSAEQLAGDEAHDRLQSILSAGLDRTLLDALWFRQGAPLEQPSLGGSTALADRLDAAAGAEPGDDALFDRVAAEYASYWTPKTGRPRPQLTEADAAVERAAEAERALGERLAGLESDLATAERLAARIADGERALTEQRPAHEARKRDLEELTALRTEVERLDADATAAAARAEQAEQAAAARRERRDRVAALDGELQALREDPDAIARTQRLEREQAELERRRTTARETTERATEARRDAAARRDDADLLARRDELAALVERRRRVDAARAGAEDAAAFLAACRLDDDGLDRIREAHTTAAHARRQLDTDAPRLGLEAIADVAVTIDGDTEELAAGEQRERAVPEATTVRIGDVALLRLQPGTSLDDLTAQRDAAEAALTAACEAAGVDSLEDARSVMEQRRKAEAAIVERDQEIAIALDGRGVEELDEAIATLDAEVTGRTERRGDDPPLPADLTAARTAVEEAEAQEAEAAEAARSAREAAEGLAEVVEELRDAQRTHEAQQRSLEEQLAEEQRRLAADRQDAADDALESTAAQTAEAASAAAEQRDAAQQRLAAMDPERVELLARNAAETLASTEASVAEARDERNRVAERLRLLGEEGLGERRELATAERVRAEDVRDRLRSRAEAAKLLFEVMSDARDRVREAYRAPLAAEIAQVGRLVYGDDVAVHLDEDLAVATRTLGGTTVPWESLSSGAREQLSLLMALATARLVADDGVPLVLDDLLGYTDPGRLERLGAVLARAGAEHQIVVLTCVAERYRHVGGATVVHIE